PSHEVLVVRRVWSVVGSGVPRGPVLHSLRRTRVKPQWTTDNRPGTTQRITGMAHAFVDQMKGLALRHGEKAGVALASMVFFLCLVKAAMMPSIETSPEQIKKAAEASDSNLNRKEERE